MKKELFLIGEKSELFSKAHSIISSFSLSRTRLGVAKSLSGLLPQRAEKSPI